jgi:site-specific recombinase XerD
LSHQKQENENDLDLRGEIYQHFIDGIKSPATVKGYRRSLRRYLTFLKLKEVDDLLPVNPSARLIELQIISYIKSLRQSGIAYATIQYLIAPIFTFYQLNDYIE